MDRTRHNDRNHMDPFDLAVEAAARLDFERTVESYRLRADREGYLAKLDYEYLVNKGWEGIGEEKRARHRALVRPYLEAAKPYLAGVPVIRTPHDLRALPLGSAVVMHGGRPGMTVQGFAGELLIDFAGQSGYVDPENPDYYPMIAVNGIAPQENA